MVQLSTVSTLGAVVLESYMYTGEVVMVHQSAIGILGMYGRVLQVHWGGCDGTVEYYKYTSEAVMVLQSTVGILGRL